MSNSKVIQRTDLGEFVYEYKCTCGHPVKLYEKSKPEKLVKCFECQCQAVLIGENWIVLGGE